MAKIGKETGKSQYENGKLILGEFFISQINNQATPSPVIRAKIISTRFILISYHNFQKNKTMWKVVDKKLCRFNRAFYVRGEH